MTAPSPDRIDASRLLAQGFLRHVEAHEELGSTNDRAKTLAEAPDTPFPFLVVTERQTAGRGRGANAWWSGEGALTFSLVLSQADFDWPAERRASLSLVTGLAVCEAVETLAPVRTLLKWPNDVLVGNRKLCGILLESKGPPDGHVVLGVGVNVNNALHTAPREVRDRATSLRQETGRPLDRTDLLAAVLQRLEASLARAGDGFAARWSSRCALTGRTVAVRSGEEPLVGTCLGIDEHGGLLLETAEGRRRVLSGVVEHVE